MEMSDRTSDAELLDVSEKAILILILRELRAMRQQERDYWETWKQKKEKELS